MVFYWFSVNVNGNWIDMELKSRLSREIVIKYNDKPVATGKLEFWSGRGNLDFIVEEDGVNVHYFVEIFSVYQGRASGLSVSRNGVTIFVTHRDRRISHQ